MKIKEVITYLAEGGNVFPGKTQDIKKEDITPTLNAYFSALKKIFPAKASIFNEKIFVPLGSARKKPVSGDIDLGINISDLLDKEISDSSIKAWGVDPKMVAADQDSFKKRAKSSTDDQVRLKAFLKNLTRVANAKQTILQFNEQKFVNGEIFSLFPQITAAGKQLDYGVQIDWMVGNLNWLSFSYASAPYPKGANIKGLHRTQMMVAAFRVANLMFSHNYGVRDRDTKELLTQDPDESLDILNQRLGVHLTRADVADYYRIHKILKAEMKPEDYNMLLNTYFKILESTRADIPNDLQDEWKKRKDQLGLTGKFLPDNSALKGI